MLQKIRTYFSPEAVARRMRQHEREGLVAELRMISDSRVYLYSREGWINKRLDKLHALDNPQTRRASDKPAPSVSIRIIEDDAALPAGWMPADIDQPRDLRMVKP